MGYEAKKIDIPLGCQWFQCIDGPAQGRFFESPLDQIQFDELPQMRCKIHESGKPPLTTIKTHTYYKVHLVGHPREYYVWSTTCP